MAMKPDLNRLSVEKDSTIHDIWKYSQQQAGAAGFDPSAMNRAVDMQRQVRRQATLRPSERFSISALMESGIDSPETQQLEQNAAMRRRSTNINLRKSIALLDEAVGTPAPLLRSATKTPAALRSAITPKLGLSIPHLDMSTSMAASTPGHSMMATHGSSMMSFGDSLMNQSQHHTTAHSGFMSQGDMGDELSTTNVALLLEEDAHLAECSNVFSEFSDSLKSHPAEHQFFKLVEQYEKICSEQAAMLKKLVRRATPSQMKNLRVQATYELLEGEKNTWRLIGSLYKDRLETEMRQDMAEEEPMTVDALGKHLSDKQIVTSLYEKEASTRQVQLVVDWLERNSSEQLDDYFDRVEFFTDQTGAWENTLHSLRQRKEGVPLHSERPMVDQMDPDAPVRQKRPLADLDQEDEARLLKFMFAWIRAGQLEEAQKLCMHCGQAWRAATLEGWRLYHDPNYDAGGSDITPVEGNPFRDIWKMACWRLSDEEQYSRHERAIYASLSGNLKQLLPVCESWADYVWAYCKCMADTRVEQEIRIQSRADRAPEQLPATYWDKPMSLDSVFREIQACPNERVRSESKRRFELIQKYIILGDIDALVEEMYECVKEESTPTPRHVLRFMAHLILLLRTIGINTKEELCVVILASYVQSLIEDQRRDLVAVFVSKLPQTLQVEWYARFLEGITDTEGRRQCLSLAEEAGLDIATITKMVVENIRCRDRTDFSIGAEVPLDTAISDEDRQKIEAIEWLIFDPCQRSEAMRQANAVMRTFLALKKHSAARAVFNKIPGGSIDVIIRTWQMQTGSTELSAEDDNTIREYLCVQAYLDAQDSFNDWFEHYHSAKPATPELVRGGVSFTERVALEHRDKQYQAEMDRWRHSLMLQTKTTEEKIYNVLLFVDGGWMQDQRKDGVPDDARSQQMCLLRQSCLSSMCFLLLTVLHATGQYKKCLQLADTVASEQHQLYAVFIKEELQKFLQRIRESSVELLNKNLDPLGYELS